MPPMCCWPMYVLGTLRWPEICCRASWTVSPSPAIDQTVSMLCCVSKVGGPTAEVKGILTLFVHLVDLVLCAEAIESLLGGAAVRAITLGEDHDGVLVDQRLDFGLCGFHCGGTCC